MISKKLFGLILAGGESSRMGTDKSLFDYHGQPQAYHLYELLSHFCNQVFISRNEKQIFPGGKDYSFITDVPEFAGHGPMSGLLSAFKTFPDVAWLVTGCDYPFLDAASIRQLITLRKTYFDAMVFINPESTLPEPLIGIYESSCFDPMLREFESKNYSLRHFLSNVRFQFILPENNRCVQSIDTMEDAQKIRLELKQIPGRMD